MGHIVSGKREKKFESREREQPLSSGKEKVSVGRSRAMQMNLVETSWE